MSDHEFKAYNLGNSFEMSLATARPERAWMSQSNKSFANRCLPMRMANQAGWNIVNGRKLRAKWLGGSAANQVLIENTGDPPHPAISHFGEGILTFLIPFLFRTPPGIALLYRGPANAPKDSIYPLEGLVETEWAVARASMNWKFTRPDTWVEFAPGEPICMVVPVCLDVMESLEPQIFDIKTDPELHRKYNMWYENCRDFTILLRNRDPEAMRLGWQRYYFNGTAPHAGTAAIPEASAHRVQLRLKNFCDCNIDDCIEETGEVGEYL
jgi:hypothetical protein